MIESVWVHALALVAVQAVLAGIVIVGWVIAVRRVDRGHSPLGPGSPAPLTPPRTDDRRN